MRYVIDANVAAKWFLPEADSAKALVTEQVDRVRGALHLGHRHDDDET